MYFDFTAFRALHIFRKESIRKFEKKISARINGTTFKKRLFVIRVSRIPEPIYLKK